MKNYGKELILDLHDCNPKLFTRVNIKDFFDVLCERIDMEQCKLTWWDDKYSFPWQRETEPHLVGITAVQFIKTSNITIHTLPLMKRVYLNIFSCKDFKDNAVIGTAVGFFEGKVISHHSIERI